MAEINLLTNESHSGNAVQTGVSLAVKVLIGVLVLVLLYYGYVWLQLSRTKSSSQELQTKISNAQSQAMGTLGRGEVVTRQGQAQALDNLIKNHLYWSYLLPELARVTLKSSSYATVSADANGVLNLTVTVPDYAEADKYLQAFDLPQYNQQFSDVKVMSISKVQQDSAVQTQLKLQLKFNPEFIRNRIQ